MCGSEMMLLFIFFLVGTDYFVIAKELSVLVNLFIDIFLILVISPALHPQEIGCPNWAKTEHFLEINAAQEVALSSACSSKDMSHVC